MSAEKVQAAVESDGVNDDVVHRIGRMIRVLRENMRELGLDKEIEKAAEAIPDARDRLSYIGTMTEDAAERALNAVDRAQPIQLEIASGAEKLKTRWQGWFDQPIELEDARELVVDTRDYLDSLPGMVESTNKELLEITMAQDFQDLTGQVIKKMIDMVHGLEFELLQIVLDNVPEDKARVELQKRANQLKKAEEKHGPDFLNGPQINPDAEDVVSSQDQVDDLLSDLGF